MDLTKRIIALSLIIASLSFTLLSAAGIVLSWTYNQQLTDSWMGQLATIEADLQTAQSDLRTARAELESVQQQIDALHTALQTLGIDGAASLQAIAEIVGRLENTLVPIITQVADRVENLRSAVLALKENLEKLNQLPLVDLEIPGIEQLDQAALNLENLQNQIEEGGDRVTQVSQITSDTVNSLTTGFAELDRSAETLSGALAGYEARISAYLVEIDALQANLPRWLDIAAAGLTVLFVWLGFSQIALFVLAWSFYTRQDLLMRWR